MPLEAARSYCTGMVADFYGLCCLFVFPVSVK
jgi:hypothetical protein